MGESVLRPSELKNKHKREKLHQKQKLEKQKAKAKKRKERSKVEEKNPELKKVFFFDQSIQRDTNHQIETFRRKCTQDFR